MKTPAKIELKRKYLLIAMAFLLLAGVVYRVWPLIMDISTGESGIALKKKQLIKYQEMFQSSRDLEKELSQLRSTLKKGEVGLLIGKTPALAAADIQKVLNEIARKSHVTVQSVRVLKPKEVGGNHYLSIPVEVAIRGNTRYLKEFLYQIMGSSKYLTAERVRITVSNSRRRRMADLSQNVHAKITINGFLKSSEEPTR
jgi:hypothetical protein